MLAERKITNYFVLKKVISSTDADWFSYGLELLFSTALSAIAIVCIAAFSSYYLYGLVYLLFFMPIRVVAGGFHAKSYIKCFLCTVLCFTVALLAALFLGDAYVQVASVLLMCVASAYVFVKAPHVSPQHLISEKKKKRQRKKTHLILGAELLLFVLGLFFSGMSRFVLIAALSTTIVAILIFVCEVPQKEKGGKTK